MGIDLDNEFKNLKEINYWQCPTTGFKWYEPKEAAGSSNLYQQLEKFDWYYMKEKWEFTKALELISNNSKILEVGVGGGYFLRSAVKKNHTVEGIELNPRSVDKMRALGFTIHELMLNQFKEKTTKRFDVVCSFQVLEHVSNPLELIKDMTDLLYPGGKLILSVPNNEVMEKIDPFKNDLLNQPPHHMGHWDKNVFLSLEKILTEVKIKSFNVEPLASYHILGMITKYLRNKVSFLGSNLSRLLVNRITTLPLQILLHLGFRRFISGHTILVEFEKKTKL